MQKGYLALDTIMRGLRGRQRELDKEDASKRERMVKTRRMELLKEARRKLENGERLSFEEMKLIYDEEEEKE